MDEMQDGRNTDNQNPIPVHFVDRNARDDEQTWTDRGNAAVQREDYESAAEAFEHAVEANPGDARARYNLALARQFLGGRGGLQARDRPGPAVARCVYQPGQCLR